MADLGWLDVAMAFVPQGATLTFEFDDDEEWALDGEEPPIVARLHRRLDVDATASCSTIPHGDESADVREFLEFIATYLDRPDQIDPDGEMGDDELGVYRDWCLIARAMLG